jgi:hypothetical protein
MNSASASSGGMTNAGAPGTQGEERAADGEETPDMVRPTRLAGSGVSGRCLEQPEHLFRVCS